MPYAGDTVPCFKLFRSASTPRGPIRVDDSQKFDAVEVAIALELPDRFVRHWTEYAVAPTAWPVSAFHREGVGPLGCCARLAWGRGGSVGLVMVLGSWSGFAFVARVTIGATAPMRDLPVDDGSIAVPEPRGLTGLSTIVLLDSAKAVWDDDGSLAHPA